jgi:hypothetical protein
MNMNKNCIASANIEVYNWWQQSQQILADEDTA